MTATDTTPKVLHPLWFILSGTRMVVSGTEEHAVIPRMADPAELGLSTVRRHLIGTIDGRDCYAADLDEGSPVPGPLCLAGVWGLFNRLDEDTFRMVLRAVHIIEWDRSDQFCSRCGHRVRLKEVERAKECPSCGYVSFPRISPAVIVLVTRGREILLARSPRFKETMYSVLAGFVEPGETIEETVRREIREETGVEVKDIRYFGSQPWPFPDSLMIAFTADYAGGDLKTDPAEIVDAAWFDVERLPAIPGKISIARRLIDWFVEKENGK